MRPFSVGAARKGTCATVDLGDVAQIYYTSGTTGEPKGVCLTYRNMIASAFDSLVGLALNEKDIWLHGAPMFHLVDAWSIWAMPLIGAPQVTLHYTPEGFMRTVQATRATATGLPPTLISMMANHPKIDEYDLGSLRLVHVWRLTNTARHTAARRQRQSTPLTSTATALRRHPASPRWPTRTTSASRVRPRRSR